ncbi:MAG: cobalamin-independent methionine synthase II family protein [Candidatus Binatia bacterium]
MKRSSANRILTTHVGSLPRPADLAEMLLARQDQAIDEAAFQERVRTATNETVARQVQIGLDVISDGEMSKPGYIDYSRERLKGVVGAIDPTGAFYFIDLVEFPELVLAAYVNTRLRIPTCEGPIEYVGFPHVARDLGNFKAALEKTSATEAFIPAVSPGLLASLMPNKYYRTYDDYLMALADAMRVEYQAITDAGFLVQIDGPDIASVSDLRSWMWDEVERRGVRAIQELHVEAINYAVSGIPPEKIRFHLCWANYMGPHTHDQPLREVLEPTLRARVGAISFEAANPAHAHEWEIFKEVRLPDGMIILPGVIDTKSQVVEHPRAVAQRIVQFAQLVGSENVIASTDCGFGSFVGAGIVHPKVAWLKLQSLVEGARLAS